MGKSGNGTVMAMILTHQKDKLFYYKQDVFPAFFIGHAAAPAGHQAIHGKRKSLRSKRSYKKHSVASSAAALSANPHPLVITFLKIFHFSYKILRFSYIVCFPPIASLLC